MASSETIRRRLDGITEFFRTGAFGPVTANEICSDIIWNHPPSGGSVGEYPELVQDFPAMDWVKDGSYYQSKRRAFLTGPYAFPVCETTVERLVSYILAIGLPHSWRDKRLVVRVPCGRRVVDAAPG